MQHEIYYIQPLFPLFFFVRSILVGVCNENMKQIWLKFWRHQFFLPVKVLPFIWNHIMWFPKLWFYVVKIHFEQIIYNIQLGMKYTIRDKYSFLPFKLIILQKLLSFVWKIAHFHQNYPKTNPQKSRFMCLINPARWDWTWWCSGEQYGIQNGGSGFDSLCGPWISSWSCSYLYIGQYRVTKNAQIRAYDVTTLFSSM